jgi:hypothetical protein
LIEEKKSNKRAKLHNIEVANSEANQASLTTTDSFLDRLFFVVSFTNILI